MASHESHHQPTRDQHLKKTRERSTSKPAKLMDSLTLPICKHFVTVSRTFEQQDSPSRKLHLLKRRTTARSALYKETVA